MKQADDAVAQSETTIQRLIAEATAERAYEEVPALADLARAIASIRSAAREPLQSRLDSKPSAEAQRVPESALDPDTPSAGPGATRDNGGASGTDGYPIYFRDGDQIVKIGRSTKSDSTYEHRASREVLDAILDRSLSLQQKSDRPFTAESLLNLADRGKRGLTIPGYQLYLCLGWLTAMKCIKRHGRRGYTVPNADELRQRVADRWAHLPTTEQQE